MHTQSRVRPLLSLVGGRGGLVAGFWAATIATVLFPALHVYTDAQMASILQRHHLPVPPRPGWGRYLVLEAPVWYSWLLLSPAITFLSRRFPLTGRGRAVHLAIHACAAVAIVAVTMAIVVLYQFRLFPDPRGGDFTFGEAFSASVAQHLGPLLIVYACIVATQHAARFNDELQERRIEAANLETLLAQAQITALKTQLQPHFLFNTLNTVLSLLHSNVPVARATLLRLSDLLRRSLRNQAHHEVPLQEELEFLEEYAEIQKTRFTDRLVVRFEIDPATRGLLVPSLLLQPLVENAIRHGLQPRREPGTVVVRSAREAAQLVLEVSDDGVGLPAPGQAAHDGSGIGLRNTRARLERMYGPEHSFSIRNVAPHGVCVQIRIPARTSSIEPNGEDSP
jgi:signal transduction histidine kinase